MTCLQWNEEIDQKTTTTLLLAALRVIRDARFTIASARASFLRPTSFLFPDHSSAAAHFEERMQLPRTLTKLLIVPRRREKINGVAVEHFFASPISLLL